MKIEESHLVYLGLGSNLGDKEENIRRAITLIGEQIGVVERQSALYDSEPWGFESDNRFVNAVICVSTTLSPHRLLRATQRIERQLGKTHEHATKRPTNAAARSSHGEADSSLFTIHYSLYKDRPIDIDILLYDNLHIDTPKLKIPHPLMQEREFVMVPLREICPTYADPEPSR